MSTKTTLKSSLRQLEQVIGSGDLTTQGSPETDFLLFSLHDLIAHMVGSSYLWPQHDGMLQGVIRHVTQDLSYPYTFWRDRVMERGRLKHKLLYKHYLYRHILAQPIMLEGQDPYFYLLMSLLHDPDFMVLEIDTPPLGDKSMLPGESISYIRTHQCRALTSSYDLANMLDTMDNGVERDLARLNCHILFYFLHLTLAMIDFEQRVRPSQRLTQCTAIFQHNLTTLRGVLLHG